MLRDGVIALSTFVLMTLEHVSHVALRSRIIFTKFKLSQHSTNLSLKCNNILMLIRYITL